MRAETGTMRFDGDWRGVFIRGDNAFGYAMSLREVIESWPSKEFAKPALEGLVNLLLSSDEREVGVNTQYMKPFAECVQESINTEVS